MIVLETMEGVRAVIQTGTDPGPEFHLAVPNRTPPMLSKLLGMEPHRLTAIFYRTNEAVPVGDKLATIYRQRELPR